MKKGYKMKKTWQKPKLIVLVRGKPEERVLGACKTSTGGGPVSDEGSCRANEQYCGDCDALGDT